MTILISDSLLMPNACLAAFAKSGGLLKSWVLMVYFLKPWYNVVNHADDIIFCLQKNSFLPPGLDSPLDLSSKTERKAIFKAYRTFKKLKYIDDPKEVEEAHLTTLRDKKLIIYGKQMLKTKA